MKVYFLQVMSCLDNEEHYENVYCTKERAIEEGKVWVDKLLRKQYKDWFEEDEDNGIPELTTEQLFKLKAVYDFSITELDLNEMEKSYDINNILKKINNMYFEGTMCKEWEDFIAYLSLEYKFDDKIIYELFKYCFDRCAIHRNYMKVVANRWKNNNIKTIKDLDKYFEEQNKLENVCKEVEKYLKRKLTEYERMYVEKWNTKYEYDFSVMKYAFEKTTLKKNPNFDYIDKIISYWKEKELKNVKEIEQYRLNNK